MTGRINHIPKTRSQTAFTFIEVLVALAVVSISMVGLIRLQMMSINLVDASDTSTSAVFLAREKLAETLSEGFPDEGSDSGVIESNGKKFHWEISVSDSDLIESGSSKNQNLRKVSVRIGCENSGKRDKLQMVTYVADRELQ